MGAAGTSSQGSTGSAANDHLTRQQARIQAAAAAASIYEKSYVYPSANTFVWYVPCMFMEMLKLFMFILLQIHLTNFFR